MLGKIKNFMSKPITWGAYFKLCGIGLGLSVLNFAGTYAYVKYEENKSYRDAVERTKLFVRNMEIESRKKENES